MRTPKLAFRLDAQDDQENVRPGAPILAGTDALVGMMLHRELELEVKAGIPPAKALQVATRNSAKLLKQENEVGSIAPGKKADFVLVDGDPSRNISDIRRCRLVAKNGTVFKSDAVYAAVGIKPADKRKTTCLKVPRDGTCHFLRA